MRTRVKWAGAREVEEGGGGCRKQEQVMWIILFLNKPNKGKFSFNGALKKTKLDVGLKSPQLCKSNYIVVLPIFSNFVYYIPFILALVFIRYGLTFLTSF